MSDKGSDNPFRSETHGIDIIPETERQGHTRQLFWVWVAAQLTLSGIIIGQLLPCLGLSLGSAHVFPHKGPRLIGITPALTIWRLREQWQPLS